VSLMTADETPRPARPPEDGNEPVDALGVDAEEPAILAEVLVEEVSIDGMCGVY
jgi:mycofactocin precursor